MPSELSTRRRRVAECARRIRRSSGVQPQGGLGCVVVDPGSASSTPWRSCTGGGSLRRRASPVPATFRRSLAAMALAISSGSTASAISDGVRPPSITRAGPYGDPLLLEPSTSALPRWSPDQHGRMKAGGGALSPERSANMPRSPRAASSGGTGATRPADDDDDDEDVPTRPGTLPTAFPKLPDPAPFAKRRSLGPHLAPDLSYQADERASLGLIGNTSRLDGRTTPSFVLPTSGRSATSGQLPKASSLPSSASKRDVGLGLSFEYRFGH